mmetsp:Transcript_24067/g.74515  ORF Transcript_24067/g.74515 Transcript_24067/m.74515 type:complete len:203 (+) Transcript_24067:138-746(+)
MPSIRRIYAPSATKSDELSCAAAIELILMKRAAALVPSVRRISGALQPPATVLTWPARSAVARGSLSSTAAPCNDRTRSGCSPAFPSVRARMQKPLSKKTVGWYAAASAALRRPGFVAAAIIVSGVGATARLDGYDIRAAVRSPSVVPAPAPLLQKPASVAVGHPTPVYALQSVSSSSRRQWLLRSAMTRPCSADGAAKPTP